MIRKACLFLTCAVMSNSGFESDSVVTFMISSKGSISVSILPKICSLLKVILIYMNRLYFLIISVLLMDSSKYQNFLAKFPFMIDLNKQ